MTIQNIKFDGINCMEIINQGNRMVITTDFGPRICFFGKEHGENLLYWDVEGYERKGWKLYGGHRVWLTRPYADESEDTYFPDNDPCDVDIKENEVTLWSPPNKVDICKGIKIQQTCQGGFKVINMLHNKGALIYSAGVWSPTCFKAQDPLTLAISLGQPTSTWDLVKIVIPKTFAGNHVKLNDKQVTYSEDFMIIRPEGEVSKRCVYSAKGYGLVMNHEKQLTFLKSVTPIKQGRYPLDGCNMAAFVGQDNFMVELESYGEEQAIIPGETIEHEEVWILHDGLIDLEKPEEIEKLLSVNKE